MKYITITFYLLVILLLVHPSCTKDEPIGGDLIEENGVIVSVPHLWKRNLHKNNQPFSNSIIREHLVYNGNPIIATTEGDDNRWINLIDIETGEDIWKWNDNYEGANEKFSIQDAHFYNNLMTYQVGSRGYCILLDNGTTFWKKRYNRSFFARISGYEENYFLYGQPEDTLQEYITYVGNEGNINTGEIDEFLYTDIDFDSGGEGNRITKIFNIEPYHYNGKTYLMVVSYDALPNYLGNQFIGLYDYDNREWIYNRKMISEGTEAGTNYIVFVGDKAYMTSGKSMNCVNIWTGERLWRKEMESTVSFSSFVVEQGKVVAVDEADNVYCWNAESGILQWQSKDGAGTSSRLRYLNGIIYFSGGSTSKIHAIDISTGKNVWLLKPELIEEDATDFKPDIYAIEGENGAKGKIVVCTHMNAYCLEAHQ